MAKARFISVVVLGSILLVFGMAASAPAAEVTEVWEARYDGLWGGPDKVSDMAVDAAGNMYVTGYSYVSSGQPDYITVKSDPDGKVLWVARYVGSGNSRDEAHALALDASGNVYVTGSSQSDYATIKYDAAGNEVWVARYDGPAHSSDSALALAVDASGNVYVTGGCTGLGHDYDYVTVKYDTDGNEVWVATYYDAGYPTAVALDDLGNVYVMGMIYVTGSNTDFITIKYDTNGNELWEATYGGSANYIDCPHALAVDGEGNAYVTGLARHSDADGDYATIKYDTDGNQVWVARYSGSADGSGVGFALAVDATGNVYVTGASGSDYATVKYDAVGNLVWAVAYDGPGNSWDCGYALSLDANGNVYVTGYSPGSGTANDYATVKYDTNGNELWVARYNGPGNGDDVAEAIAVDAVGNVFVTGNSAGTDGDSAYATVKYDTGGNELWVARYDGALASDLAVDAAGYVYVTGSDSGDYVTIKYDGGGNELWATWYDGPENGWDEARALALDAEGNVYVTGHSAGSTSADDYSTVKYDAGGNELWVATYNGPGNGDDVAEALAVDAEGNVYVTGSSLGTGGDSAYATVKYDADGNELWVARYDGALASDLAVDAAGNVYVTGCGNGDYATIKYDADGNELWVSRYDGLGNDYDYANALALDDMDNVYVTGFSHGPGTYDDYATVKYDAGGNELWVARYNGPGNVQDYGEGLALDASGNVYVTGMSTGVGTSYDSATVKYDANGNEVWVARYNGPDNYNDGTGPVALDALGNVYVAGWSDGASTSRDYITVKYDGDGNELWAARFDGPGNDYDYAKALALDDVGNVYVAGRSTGLDISYDYTTLKYAHPAPDVTANGSDGPVTVAPGDALSVSVELSDQSYENWDADWWVLASTPLGLYHYDLSGKWLPGMAVTHQGPLYDLLPTEVLNSSGLPAGSYIVHFGVDTVMDGALGSGERFSDEMEVNVQ